MSDSRQSYNTEVRDKWIAKSLGIRYSTLMKQTFFVSSDEDSKQLIVTFIPSTSPALLNRLKGFEGSTTIKITNTSTF